jgi:hypothetical protein
MKTKDGVALRPMPVSDAEHHIQHEFQPGQMTTVWNPRTRKKEARENQNFCKVCGRRKDHVLHKALAKDTKLRSGINVTICPICKREVVAKSGVIQPHANMKTGGWCNGAAKGEDSGILDHPLAALAALLGILIAFQRGPSQGERNQEANYDLTKYRPAPREW